MKKNRGRPPKITNTKLIDRCLGAIKSGAYIETAAAFAGIAKDTFYNWLKHGARVKDDVTDGKTISNEDQLYVNFSDAVEKAQAEAEIRDLLIISSAAKGGKEKIRETVKYEKIITDSGKVLKEVEVERTQTKEKTAPSWQASAWRLERKFPDKWGRRTIVAGDKERPMSVRYALPDNGRDAPK